MAKFSTSTKFSKAQITFEEDGRVLITEYLKDDTKTYDLLEVLRGFDGVENINLSISKDAELTPEGDTPEDDK